jgi:serine/threonine protein kinase/Tol biopolymer transport system component
MSAPALERLRSALGDRYAIERELGSGAMATVYLARDVKHHRDVAVKVLHPELAAALGAERFLREVDVLAHLHHPHILPLFDSGQADGCLYYVMPRVEGESLRDRLQRERQLPIDEALQITREVAAALDHAHRRHVIHRDIKPANILLQDGQALVADFGIALAARAAGGERMTGTGLSLGTPWYMSPEQAAGDRDLDARSDVYSLAAVLYEMLTGEPPHTGRDAQVVLAKVVMEPVRPVRAVRDTVPPHVETALQKALAKLPADRFSSTAAFARALAEPDVRPEIAAPRGRLRLRRWPAAAVSGWSIVVLGILIGGLAWRRSRTTPNPESSAVRRWNIVLADSTPLVFVGTAPLGVGRTSLAISRDGTHLVYVAQRGTATQLYLRELDKLDATPLAGTVGANQPFFSPDGQWIGFFAGRELKKVSLRGDQPVTLAAVTEPYGAAWAADGRILVVERQGNRLAWVPSSGGAPRPLERQIETRVFSPQFVAGGEWILHGSVDGVLYLHALATGWSYAVTRDGVVRRDSADVDALLYGANPRYLASGHIAYFSGDGTLMALPFDISRRRVLGPPVPILEGIRLEAEAGDAQLTVSQGGTLVYAPGESARLSQFVWVDHAGGRVDTLLWPRAAYGGFDLSPDGRQILVRIRSASSRGELWTLDVDGGGRARVSTHGILIGSPRWWPDGARAVFYELPPDGGRMGVVTVLQSVGNPVKRDTLPLGALGPGADGRHLIQSERGLLWLVSTEQPDRRVQLTLSGRAGPAALSPDGRWLAHVDLDDPGGESAVYVTRVGRPAERYKISAAGGEEPVWTPNGRSVIYRDRQEWFAVDVSTTGAFRAGRPRVLFRGPFLQVPGASHDISPDGHRQLVLLGPAAETTNRLVVVTNWFAEVERLAQPSADTQLTP